jgi:DNA-binding transcriptional MerR regulator
MANKLYKIKDLALRLDRSILTIKRWEKQGLLPKARKDSRGWRVYTEAEVQEILKKVRETNYFRNGKSHIVDEAYRGENHYDYERERRNG